MNTRRLNEVLIGLLTLGKAVELGRQLVLTTDKNFAGKVAGKLKVKPESLQKWGPGYVAFDAVISVMGVLAMLQGMRKNRKGAGQAALVQGGAVTAYSLFYLVYSVLGLKEASTGQKLINVVASLAHTYSGIKIIRFARKALD
ncbi:MAG: hypothetical protein JWP00_4973 [Chloroflexi bacterium]|jgi:hypothetical protein|nr:hypothetical protein [Chloroflexota bacterium]